MTLETLPFSNKGAAEAACSDWLAGKLVSALENTPDRVTVLVSGGSTPTRVLPAILTRDLDWNRIDCVASDERIVAPSDPDSTEGMIHRLFSEAGRPLNYAGLGSATVPDAALAEWRRARADIAWPPAVGLLGIGEDGHTASLFPGRPEAEDPFLEDALVPETAPHRHPRVTLGLKTLGQCPALGLVIAGAGKRQALKLDPAGLFRSLAVITRVMVFSEEEPTGRNRLTSVK
ncbi:6-phosphogluconolactonase [Roseovarius indicus]|uniref:6-phosphogluconolactonase n=1 Tax=Roseovarius indicus TaxID=540747 RepID=A0A5P3AHE7_9RHOB|nr:6-phosphogluconolactonase [Roseovarius indicus]SFE56557.1 6-phosphogluconolactonase [Roseovarius indicus]